MYSTNDYLQNEDLQDLIEKAIQGELRYDKDNITTDGWAFLEEEAPQLILEAIEEDDLDEDEINNLTLENIEQYLGDIICEYEQIHANIRYYEREY